ncbi:MAG TPA: MSMEG_0570 family nitrogen starvation response protein [Paraburkholderia sp.]|nr:MSMEG_0570 family nitrogen starvation response protein [Paraburkholderia sp.]
MPVMHFKIRWPDGIEASCYSPSTVVGEFFVAGERYPVDDFVARAREALNIGSERVREKYGFACSAALDQLAQIEAAATRFQGQPDAQVTLLELAE